MLETIRPKLIVIYHLDDLQIEPHYKFFYYGLIFGSLIFGLLVSNINYRTCFISVAIIQVLGLVKLLSLSPIIVNTPAIHQLKSGMLLLGIGGGGIFSIIHPLIALIYTDPHQSKTKIMNYLHTCWPLFVILTCLYETSTVIFNWDWYWNIYATLLFTCIYAVIALFLPLPIQTHTHRIPISARIRSIVRPSYVLLSFCMVCFSVLQFSPSNWIRSWIEIDLQIRPIFLVIYCCSIQLVFRLFAGSIAQRISPPGLLGLGSILSAISLFSLSIAQHPTAILIAIAILVIGSSWSWPTFISIVADRYPLSGGLGMGVINYLGFITMFKIIPRFSEMVAVENVHQTFADMGKFSILSIILIVAVFLSFRAQGGYKVLSAYDRST